MSRFSDVLSRPGVRLAAAVGGVILVGAGEWVVRSGNTSGLGLLLYVSGIVLFAPGAWPLPHVPADLAPPPRRAPRWAFAALAGAGVAALAFELVALRFLVARNKFGAEHPWMVAVALLAIAGLLGASVTEFPARWDGAPPGASRTKRLIFWGCVALILVLAIATRFPALDRIPYGINADEGDQAAIAMEILRGTSTRSIFDVGWYHIGMIYFHLLAAVMSIAGISVGGARVLGALCGLGTVALVIVIGTRHFGRRAGILAGLLCASAGAAIQFSRETTCAGPTALLWTASAALFLEAARTGRAWAWIGAGLTGGLSIYFYPSGRLWAVIAVVWGLLLLVEAVRRRGRIFAGLALAAVSSFVVASPFLHHARVTPGFFTVRARETTILLERNRRRLSYYDPGWSEPMFAAKQFERSLGIFNRYADGNFFWPTNAPILPPAFAALTLLGLGVFFLRIRDPRSAYFAIWFVAGFAGVVLTVETPNLHRMSTAVPLIPIAAALVLSELARRLADLSPARDTAGAGRYRARALFASGLVGLAGLALSARELTFYFGEYAKFDAWPYPRVEGQTVAAEGETAWVVGLAREFHMVNSGWVYLWAPNAPRAGVLAPGSELPLTVPADRDLAFLVYPRQPEYFGFLESLYPGGVRKRITHPPDAYMFDVYRVPSSILRSMQGALAHPPGGRAVRVPSLGDAPPNGPFGKTRWTAALRTGSFWNYAFRLGPSPSRLVVDGKEIGHAARGEREAKVVVGLARGDHFVELEGETSPGGPSVTLEWGESPPAGAPAPAPVRFERPLSTVLRPMAKPPGGLFGTIVFETQKTPWHRLDGAIATGGLSDEIHAEGHAYLATWRGALEAPESGVYRMAIFSEGDAELKLDGRTVLKAPPPNGDTSAADVVLSKGRHEVFLSFRNPRGPGGLQWTWKLPSEQEATIVPPSALTPPAGAGVEPELTVEVLGLPALRWLERSVTFRR